MADPMNRHILIATLCLLTLSIAGLSSCKPYSSSTQNDSTAAVENQTPVEPPPPPPNALLGRISPTVLSELSGLPVMVPAYIPPAFALADYSSKATQSYSLIYRNPEGQCFAIEYSRQTPAAEPTGELTVISFDLPAFGPMRELYFKEPASASTSPLFSQWMTNANGAYRFISAATIAQNYPHQKPCQNVSLEEAKKIISSIANLTAYSTD